MHREVIELDFRQSIDVEPEQLARPAAAVHHIDNDSFRRLALGQYRIKENLSNRAADVKHAHVTGDRKILVEPLSHGRPKSVVSDQDVAISQNQNGFVVPLGSHGSVPINVRTKPLMIQLAASAWSSS